MSPPAPEITALPGGLRVATQRMPGVRSAAVGVWVAAGARSESAATNGVSHLLEHMAFKGTESRSARDIAEQVEAAGAYMNAYTGREETAYHLRLLPQDLPLAVDILSDILLRPRFAEEDLAREREVIVQEIGEARDDPSDAVFDGFQESAFPDQPLGRPVMGTPEGVRGLARETLRDYMDAHYRGGGMVLAAAGDVRHDVLVELAERAFADLASDSPPRCEPGRYAGGDARNPRPTGQTYLVLGFEGVPHDDPDFYACVMLASVLGGGMSSRLFQEVRERRGLAYDIHAFAGSFRDTGVFGVSAGTAEKDAGEVLRIVADVLADARERVLPEEIGRAAAQARSGLLMAQESCAGRAESLARHLLVFGRPIGVDEQMDKLAAVDEDALRRTAARVLASPPTLAAVGPDGGVPDVADLRARFR